VSEDCGDGADFAGRFGDPCGRVEMFDQELVHAFINGEDPNGGLAELSVKPVDCELLVGGWARSLLLA